MTPSPPPHLPSVQAPLAPPAPPPPDAPVLTRRLPNGVLALAVPMPGATTTLLAAEVRVGSRYESVEDAGLSHFLEHMVFLGTAGLPTGEAVNEAAERMGTALDAYTSRDTTHFEHRVSPEMAPAAAHLLADVLARPAFRAIESERSIILEEALDEVDEHGRLIDAETLSRDALWPGCGLGRSVVGVPRNIERFDEADLRRHHRRHYAGENVVVSLAGAHEPATMLDWLAAAFDALPLGPRLEPPPPPSPPARPRLVYVDDARSQIDCRLVMAAPGTTAALAPALALARMALDDGLASRLHRRLGNDLGLAYDLWATLERYPDAGALEVGAQLSPGKVVQFFTETQALLEGLVSAPPEGEELARLRFRARFHMRAALEHAETRVQVLAHNRLYPCEPDDIAERIGRYDAVEPGDIARAMAEVLAGAPIFVAVGKLPRSSVARLKALVTDRDRPRPSRRSEPPA